MLQRLDQAVQGVAWCLNPALGTQAPLPWTVSLFLGPCSCPCLSSVTPCAGLRRGCKSTLRSLCSFPSILCGRR